MAIVDVHIDDRLIHGQVCSYWIPHNNVDKIVVVDNKIVKDEIRKSALKLGCPGRVKLSILDALTASDKLKRNLDKGNNVMLLASGPSPFLEMVEDGYKIDKITIGNMSARGDDTHIKKTVYLSNDDIRDFKRLAELGVRLTIQLTPQDMPDDLEEILKRI